VTVLFTDLVDSTGILNHDGADRSETVRRSHFAALRHAVRHCRGEEIKTTGDGLMVIFRSAGDAVECAVSMQRAVARLRRTEPHFPEVRIGLSAGEATVDDGDWYGQPVVEAARLCAVATRGQILLAEVVAVLLRTWTRHRIVAAGRRELKGFDEPVVVRQVAWTGGELVTTLPPAVAPVAREILVDREVEAARLARAWERAKCGERQVVFVGGEPGIGKTCLASELARKAHDDGGTVLWGRSDEEMDIPYQAFVESLQHLLEQDAFASIVGRLGDRVADLARLLPQIVDGHDAAVPADPNADRLWLFDAVSRLIVAASNEAPVLLVLDDLHWAPCSALRLLRHIARDPHDASLLIVCTYRDTDLDSSHPLVELLADLQREQFVERLDLEGLPAVEVVSFLEAVGGGRELDASGRALAGVLHRETGGNPLFFSQLLRHLTEAGAVAPGDGRWAASRPLTDYGMPEGIRDVIARRLARLSDAAVQALKVGAVVGNEFDLRTLEHSPAAAPDPLTLLDSLEESARARLVVELERAPGTFRFTHTLVRQTLLDTLCAARRARLHLEVARAVEAGSVGHEPLDVLAYHYCEAATVGGAAPGVRFAERAALQGLEKLAFEAAIDHLERGLRTLELAGAPDAETRARLLVTLAEAHHLAGDVSRSKAVASTAADAARAVGSPKLLARAAMWRSAFPLAGVEDPPAAELLEEALGALPEGDHRVRASLLGRLAVYRAVNEGQGPAADGTARRAVSVARSSGDATALMRALTDRCLVLQGEPDLAVPRRHCEELRTLLASVPVRERAAAEKVLRRQDAVIHLQSGDVKAFDTDVRALARSCAASPAGGDWVDQATVAMWQALQSMLTGRFEDAERRAGEMLERAPHEANFQNSFAAQLFLIRRDEGRLAEIEYLLRGAVQATPRLIGFRIALALTHAELGDRVAARHELEPLVAHDYAAVPYVGRASAVAMLVEACAESGVDILPPAAYELLEPCAGQLLVVGWGAACLGAADRFLGTAAALAGRAGTAAQHFEAAEALEEAAGLEPLLARTRFSHARALMGSTRRADRVRARSLLDLAATTADDLGMRGLRHRVMAIGGRLQ
jgi:hypothetical protein